MNHVYGADGSGGSSVTTVTRVQAGGYEARKRGVSLVLSLQIGTEAHKTSLEWVLQIKRTGRETEPSIFLASRRSISRL